MMLQHGLVAALTHGDVTAQDFRAGAIALLGATEAWHIALCDAQDDVRRASKTLTSYGFQQDADGEWFLL